MALFYGTRTEVSSFECRVSSFCLSGLCRSEVSSFLVGPASFLRAPTTHINDVLGCGGPGVLCLVRNFAGRRLGGLRVQEKNSAHVGTELTQDDDFPVKRTQKRITDALNLIQTTRVCMRRANASCRLVRFRCVGVIWGRRVRLGQLAARAGSTELVTWQRQRKSGGRRQI